MTGQAAAPTPTGRATSRPATSSTDVVRRLEAGGATLEESLALWERGEVLATICQEWLDGARARLDAARQDDLRKPADGGRQPT